MPLGEDSVIVSSMLELAFCVTTPEEVTSAGRDAIACATRFCTLTDAMSGSVPTLNVTDRE